MTATFPSRHDTSSGLELFDLRCGSINSNRGWDFNFDLVGLYCVYFWSSWDLLNLLSITYEVL